MFWESMIVFHWLLKLLSFQSFRRVPRIFKDVFNGLDFPRNKIRKKVGSWYFSSLVFDEWRKLVDHFTVKMFAHTDTNFNRCEAWKEFCGIKVHCTTFQYITPWLFSREIKYMHVKKQASWIKVLPLVYKLHKNQPT